MREALSLVPAAVREVRDLAQLLWREHEKPAGSGAVLRDAPRETRETWWHTSIAALTAMNRDPEVSSDHDEMLLAELAGLMRVGHARALDRDAAVTEPDPADREEWLRLAVVARVWRAEATSKPQKETD